MLGARKEEMFVADILCVKPIRNPLTTMVTPSLVICKNGQIEFEFRRIAGPK